MKIPVDVPDSSSILDLAIELIRSVAKFFLDLINIF